jgi:F420-0:gamma-glutamyl ligase
VGIAIGVSGFVPIQDRRGVHDIFGRPIRVTQANVADDIASAAHLLMGESRERVGAVIIRGSAIARKAAANGRSARLPPNRCLIGNSLVNNAKKRTRKH